MTPSWRLALPLTVLSVIALLVLYAPVVHLTWRIWVDNETYAHGVLIPMVTLWLLWRDRAQSAKLAPRPAWQGLPLLLLLGAAWELGHQSAALVVQQYALVGMLLAVVWTLLGTRVFRTHLFALLFLVLAVPFGDFLIPPMMDMTARFTVAALRLVGVPVFQEGNVLTLPTGTWSVVEACSGLRYFVASVTLGVLFAHLIYRSRWRQAVFVLASIIVPVVANEIRAFLIVMIGHLSNMRLATGIDHIIYGWLFFGLVMLILFKVGALFREDDRPAPPSPSAGAFQDLPARPPTRPAPMALATILCLVLSVLPLLYAHHLDRLMDSDPGPLTLTAPTPSGSWQTAPPSSVAWAPHYEGSRAQLSQTYRNDTGEVTLYLGYYRHQHPGNELITVSNALVLTVERTWSQTSVHDTVLHVNGTRLPLEEAVLSRDPTHLMAWRWYWVAGRWINNAYLAKALEAMTRLLYGKDDSAVVVVWTPMSNSPEAARERLDTFVRQALPGLRQRLEAASHE